MTEYHFSFDGEPVPSEVTCVNCGARHDVSVGFVLNHGDAFASYRVEWYPHDEAAYLDAVLGSFDEPEYADNVTFGCRYGYVDGTPDPAASLRKPERSGPVYGRILDRDAALASGRLNDFWAVTDWAVVNDPLLKMTVYELPSRPADPT